MPMIWIIPIVQTDIKPSHTYICPTYITSQRFGVLTTTGLSSNFVMAMKLPMAPEDEQRKWIKRGVAMLTTLDD